jgi:hypothetical protein
MYPKLKINVYFIFLNIGDLTFGITLVYLLQRNKSSLYNRAEQEKCHVQMAKMG